MSNVTVSIGGRSYTVACDAGEERHVIGLGAVVDEKLREMGDLTGQTESRMLLFAALLLADELHARPAAAETASDTTGASADLTARLEAMAVNLESLASRLEQ